MAFLVQPPASHPNQLRGHIAPGVARLLGGALGALAEAEEAATRTLRHRLNPARMFGQAELVHCIGRRVVRYTWGLVQYAGGVVCRPSWRGGEQEQGEEAAHGPNVLPKAATSIGAVAWSFSRPPYRV